MERRYIHEKTYIRNYGNGNYACFTEEEYNNKLKEELEELREFDEDYTDMKCIEDYELVGIIEYNSENCETIEDAILELLKNDTSDLLYNTDLNMDWDADMYSSDNTIYNIGAYSFYADDIMKDKYVSIKIREIENTYFRIEFDIVEIDKDNFF